MNKIIIHSYQSAIKTTFSDLLIPMPMKKYLLLVKFKHNQYILKMDLFFVMFQIWMIAILALNLNLKTWFASNSVALNPILWG
jgi:hypothetical protein